MRKTLATAWSLWGRDVQIGTDRDGRTISYVQANNQFSIGGIDTSVDRLVAYDRGGYVTWASDEYREWVHEYDRAVREHAAASQQALEAVALTQPGPAPSPDAKTRLDVFTTVCWALMLSPVAAWAISVVFFDGPEFASVYAFIEGMVITIPLFFVGLHGLIARGVANKRIERTARGRINQ